MNKKENNTNGAVRRDARHPQIKELSVVYEGFSENIVLRAPDLSSHGMFINTAKEFAEGSVLKVRFRLSRSGILIEARCEVRYCLKGVGVGVEFVAISPECAEAIEEEVGILAAQD